MTAGLRDPVHGAQQVFRTVLGAMSHPGRMQPIPVAAIDGLTPFMTIDGLPAFGVGVSAVLLALLDVETSVFLVGTCASAEAHAYLRFHTGVRAATSVQDATFVVARASELDAAWWSLMNPGSDEAPQDGATLILEVDTPTADADAPRLVLRGPGIAHETALQVRGIPRAFWKWRVALQALLPRGIDLVLADDTTITALPRSTRVTLGDSPCT
jgi:alpha-D-ribose 1-methylphosphonate 5-triphosphate synthase subunit PhnH